MEDNLSEMADECPLNSRSLLSIVCIQLGAQKVFVIWSSRVSAI